MACTQTSTGELTTSEEDSALIIKTGATTLFPIEDWDPRSELRWPGEATTVQVLLRRGHEDGLAPATFYAFLVADGSQLVRALRVRVSDQDRFMANLNVVLTVAETPGSTRSHSIAGSLWVGPKPVGPPGDGLGPRVVARLVRSAGELEDATAAAVGAEL